MSRETSQWLHDNILIGYTEKRGRAWWYKRAQDGVESNHYDGPIPIEDVERRLFDWEALKLPAGKPIPERDEDGKILRDDNGEIKYTFQVDPDRVYIQASDTDETFSIPTDTYAMHQYRPWLLDTVADLLDDDLKISSAGLLQNRGVAWVEVSMEDNRVTPEGVEYRPNLLASTSFNQSIASTFGRKITCVVCDNTHDAALAESGQQVRIPHTKNSGLRIAEARDALAIVVATAGEFEEAVKRMCDQTVTEDQWNLLLREVIPVNGKSKTAETRAMNVREKLDNFYRYDSRVTPWAGSAFGAFQAWSTYNTHERQVNSGTSRVERNALADLKGDTVKLDNVMINALRKLVSSDAELEPTS